MSDFINSVILTTNTNPYTFGLVSFILALFAVFALVVVSMTGLHYEYECDCEENSPIFTDQETRPLLDSQDPLKDYPYGRYVTRTVSAKRAKKQSVNRAILRQMLEVDWAESSYGTITAAPRVGEKRKMRDEGLGRGKRIRMEESSEEDSEW